jgi:1-aminocyclopropane-1-carboxylate deaminase/D-cysteine desulfhydrase-like pyridoxal-dependent ACC family enzyme
MNVPITPLERLPGLSRPGTDLWVKRDDLTDPTYGGNKVRKLVHLLADARARGAHRLVTLGAAGSHHVLATTVFGKRAGFDVAAVLVPQPRTLHVVDNVRADIAQGLDMRASSAIAWAPFVALFALRAFARGTAFITVGGSNVVGSLGYVDAAREIALQVRDGAMPEPDVIVVALGSGGTVAGLAAGLAIAGLRTRVVAVSVSSPPRIVAFLTRRLVRGVLRHLRAHAHTADALRRITFERGYLGPGYGHATPDGIRALELAAGVGLKLDLTYTAKTFACALDRVASGEAKTVLYLHTLSSAPLAPLLTNAPSEGELAVPIRALLR